MLVVIEPAQTNTYEEDISSTKGESIVGGPCVLRSVTFVNDTGSSIVCSLHDSLTVANAANKKVKVVVATNSQVQLQFVAGKKFTYGIWAKPNAAGMDISMDYD